MSEDKLCFITFPGVTQVLKAENCLSSITNSFEIVPIPREITADCGMCIMCTPENLKGIIDMLTKSKMQFEQVHILKRKTGFLDKLFER